MNAELAKKLALRRQWEEDGAASKPAATTSSRPAPAVPPSRPTRKSVPPPIPTSARQATPPPVSPRQPLPSPPSPPNRQSVPPPVPSARTVTSARQSVAPPVKPRSSRTLTGSSRNVAVPKNQPPPPLSPGGKLKGAAHAVNAANRISHPPPPVTRQESTESRGNKRASYRPPPPRRSYKDNSQASKRGVEDFRKPRPDSLRFQKKPPPVPTPSQTAVPPVPTRSSSRRIQSRGSSTGSARPPAPGFDSNSGLNSAESGDSHFSGEERHELALKGKEIFNRTISQDDGQKQARRGSGSKFKYCRVDESFDAAEEGFSRAKSDSFLALEEDDVVEITGRIDSEWWEGKIWDPMRGKAVGKVGKFPSSYVAGIRDPYDPWDEGEDDMEDEAVEEPVEETVDEAAKKRHKKWRNMNRFFFALLELLTNEFKYVVSLRICFELFVTKINEKFGNDYVGVLFPSWVKISRTHEDILKKLSSASRASWQKLQKVAKPGKLATKRESLVTVFEQIPGNRDLELVSIGGELDTVQTWHDACILDKDDSLPDEIFDEYSKILCEWCVSVSNKLGEICDVLKVSSVYIRNFNDAMKKLDQWTKTIAEFKDLIASLSAAPMAKGLNLAAYLIKPVQHICRYPLLIREVHKNAPDEKTQDVVLNCQIRLIEVTTEVNSMQEAPTDEDRMTVVDLRSALRIKNERESKLVQSHLEKPTTALLKYGEVGVIQVPAGKNNLKTGNSGTTYEAFLLNGFLIVTDKYQNFIGKHRYKSKMVIHMDNIGLAGPVESHSNNLFAMSVISKDDPEPLKGQAFEKSMKWVFSTATIDDRDNWIRNIEQALSITRGLIKPTAIDQSAAAPAAANSAGAGGKSDPKYNSLKETSNTLQSAHPSFLLQLQNQDPLIKELRNKLRKPK